MFFLHLRKLQMPKRGANHQVQQLKLMKQVLLYNFRDLYKYKSENKKGSTSSLFLMSMVPLSV